MRKARGTHPTAIWQRTKLLVMLVLALAASVSLQKSLTTNTAAKPLDDLKKSTSEAPSATQPTSAATPEHPTPTSPADMKPAEATMRWTATATAGVADTYNIRVSQAATTNESGELAAPTLTQDNLTSPEYAPPEALADGTYYWQVRACDQLGVCTKRWSPVWSMAIDSVAPTTPTATIASDTYSTTVTLSGSAEPGSHRISIVVGEERCTTLVDSDGQWACTISKKFEYGNYTATVSAADKAGNESVPISVDFSVKELFVAEEITTSELPATLEIVPMSESPKNEVDTQPVTSRIDIVNTGNAGSDEPLTVAQPLTTEGGLIQASENGWQVLGLPWFIWFGSAASLTGGWWIFGLPGSRRISGVFSL